MAWMRTGWARRLLQQMRAPLRSTPRGITARISGLSWMVAFFSLLLFMAGSIPEQKREIEENLQSKARGIAASLQEVLARAAVSEDYSGVVEQCGQALNGDRSIDFVVVAKSGGFALMIERNGWRTAQVPESWRPRRRDEAGGIEVAAPFGRRVYRYAVPYNFSSIPWGWIHVGLSLDSYDQGVARLHARMTWLALVCTAGSMIASMIVARRLAGPILRLETVVGRIARGDLSARASIHSVREIDRLAQSFNSMAASLLQRDEILESVRFAAQRFLSAAAWQTVIQEVISKIGEAAQVSRVFLLERRGGETDGLSGRILHSWLRPGIACAEYPAGDGLVRWSDGDWNRRTAALERGELVLFHEDGGGQSGPALAPPSLSSILVPVEVGGGWFGVLGFDDCAHRRAWSDPELDSFRSAARMLGAAITRQEAQEYVDNILRSMGEALLVTDAQFMVRRVNPSALRLLGYREEELSGQPLARILEGGAPARGTAVERAYRTRSGAQVPVLFSCAELRSGAGSLDGYVCLAQELSELKRTQAELERARDLAENANRTKSVFLANMSHELRTPLNAIIGYSQMLREDCIGPEQPEVLADLEKIERSGQLLLGIINDILDLSKIEAGRVTVTAENIDIPAVLEDVVNAVQPLARQQDDVLEVHCPREAGTAWADLAKFRQSVLNLVNNAVKFTERGRVSVAVNRRRIDGADWVEVQVSDTGIGIGPEHLTKLFQPFSQVDGSATRKYNGTGLGLAISKKFCQMMGGDITVESILGHGSRFSMRVPAGKEGGATEPKPIAAELT